MENYFNYFTEIEEHFQRRRGTLLLLSTLDWALIESWKMAEIPLEAVLRGIDATFDKYERRPVKSRKINGLAYCAQEVLAAAEEMKEAAVGTERATERESSGLERDRVVEFLSHNAEKLRSAKVPEAAKTLCADDASALEKLAAELKSQPAPNFEELELRMTVMEEKLLALLLTSTSDDVLVSTRGQAERELAPYRSKMSAVQIDNLLKQYTNKKLLELYNLPRLSLFYM